MNRNDQVRLALEPFCIGCHGEGANHPFFASLPAFESLLVANPAYVVPGDAASSKLTGLLRGTATGSFTQMPPFGMPYATRPEITMPMTEIDAWINEMGAPPTMEAVPDPDAPHIRRMTAEDILRNLYLQLGMTEVDFCGTYYSCGEYGVVVNDAIGERPYMVGGSFQRFDALGGPNWLKGRARNNGLSPTFLQTFTHVSQAWCRKAVEKTGGNVILDGVTLADTSASNAAGIQANIRRLYLRMLADVPPEPEVQLLFTDVFQHYESVDTKTAWTAVCTALVRHPKWLFY